MAGLVLYGVEVDAQDAARTARFWAGLLGWREQAAEDVVVVAPDGEVPFRLLVRQTVAARQGRNRIHLDLTSSTAEDMRATVGRALELGGRRIDIGQAPDNAHEVMADPEGNELCVIEPGNRFLAGTGVVGAINCDGTRALGHFWSAALDWPLVWDQDEETAIQSPSGGTKVTWSGPPLMARHGRDRLRLVVTVAAGAEIGAVLTRLTALGAKRLDDDGDATGSRDISMADPDGNEFRIVHRQSPPAVPTMG